MSLKDRLLDMHWTLTQRWFGVWEVRNYYTTLERRAKAGAEITYGYVLMVLTSATLATGGLLLDSPAVVIGSMCVAPFLGPSRAVCIGGLFRNRKVLLGGLLKQLFGLRIDLIIPEIALSVEAKQKIIKARDFDKTPAPSSVNNLLDKSFNPRPRLFSFTYTPI